ncbi:MAG: hypothetical protein CMJ58_19155 [Planctomycetaceae bacterium]|nr:hypothetical protein [Planctomycetaceae bacterium]
MRRDVDSALLRAISRTAAPAALLVLAACLAGCSETEPGVAVRGAVSVRGEPLPAGSLTFFPSSGPPTVARVSEQGTYEVRLEPGDYRVTVAVKVELPPDYQRDAPLPPPKVSLPQQYSSRANTPLSATVSADQSTPIDFEVQ